MRGPRLRRPGLLRNRPHRIERLMLEGIRKNECIGREWTMVNSNSTGPLAWQLDSSDFSNFTRHLSPHVNRVLPRSQFLKLYVQTKSTISGTKYFQEIRPRGNSLPVNSSCPPSTSPPPFELRIGWHRKSRPYPILIQCLHNVSKSNIRRTTNI